MRTIFTTEDIKTIIDTVFNGNLWRSKATKGAVAYENPNSEKILVVEQDTGIQEEKDLAEYLSVGFYTWKNRLMEKADQIVQDTSFMSWVESLNSSMNEAYALVECVDSEAVPSQDIDSATFIGKITFAIQADKAANLDYYLAKLRNSLLGVPVDFQNSYGDMIKLFIHIGTLIYDTEPLMTQIGETIIVTANITINYLTDALTYSDTKIELSFDGTEYDEAPVTKATFQNIFISQAVTKQDMPNKTGYIATSSTIANTFSFFDFNKGLMKKFNNLFWATGADYIDGVAQTSKAVTIPVWLRVTSAGKAYIYKCMIDNMQKVVANGDFNVSSITLKGYGK